MSLPPPQLLIPTCEPTLRAVIAAQKAHWSCLRDIKKGELDDFFAEAARVGQAPRVSKRSRTATTFADEADEKLSRKINTKKAAVKEKVAQRAGKRQAATDGAAALAAAEKDLKAAQRRLKLAEDEVRRAESAVEAASAAAARLEAAAEEADESDASSSE